MLHDLVENYAQEGFKDLLSASIYITHASKCIQYLWYRCTVHCNLRRTNNIEECWALAVGRVNFA